MSRFVSIALRNLVLLVFAACAIGAKPVVIAHRGASGYLPEHTLAAVSLAYGMKADFIEQDLVLSRDGQPVVLHDIHIDTVTNVAKKFPDRAREDGRFYAIDFALAELRTLAVHERTDVRSGKRVYEKRFPSGKSRFQIVTLAEEIELIQGLNISTGRNVGIYPEIKQPSWHHEQGQDITKIVLDELKKYGYDSADDRCYLQCFEAGELKRVRKEFGSKLPLVQLLSGRMADMQTASGLREIASYAQGIGPSLSSVLRFENGKAVNSGLVSRAHKAGLVVHPYTVRADVSLPDGVQNFGTLLHAFVTEARIDGMFTDHPDLCVAWLAEQVLP